MAPETPSKRQLHQDKDIVKKAWKAGWPCVRKGNYIYCFPPGGEEGPVQVKSTPSGSRYLKNLEKTFERAGLAR